MNYNKLFLTFNFLFFCLLGYSQDSNDGFSSNLSNNLSTAASNNISNHGSTGYFYNPKRAVDGSEFLFDSWENNAVIFTTNNNNFKLKNINLNIKSNSFLSKINKDSIFTFNMSGIDKIVINNKIYKNVYIEETKAICEVVFESEKYSVLKSFYIQTVDGSPNPMINRANDKIIRKKRFYVLEGESVNNFRFSKRKVLALVNDNDIETVKEYVKKNDLSYRNEIDVKQILNFNTTL
jgi:hypothetical protein